MNNDYKDYKKDYKDEEILTLDFEDGTSAEYGIVGVFDVDGQDYIALEALDGSDEILLYGYRENEDDFDLLDIEDEATFDKVAAEFESLMDEPL